LRGEASQAPDYLVDPFLVPSAPYSRGGHHFSNGATWVEAVRQAVGLAGTVKPAFQGASSGAANYAVGGARASEDGINVNLPQQVNAFLLDAGGTAPADRLYVIEMGSNDIRDALVTFAGGGNGAPILQRAVGSIAQNIQALYAAGARTFLVWRPPNVGLTPAIRTLDRARPGAAQLASAITQSFNAGLDGAVAQLSALPGITIVRLDAFRLLNDLTANPGAFGLTNVTAACITPGRRAVHVPGCRRVSLLGRHPSEQGRARDHRAGSGLRAGALSRPRPHSAARAARRKAWNGARDDEVAGRRAPALRHPDSRSSTSTTTDAPVIRATVHRFLAARFRATRRSCGLCGTNTALAPADRPARATRWGVSAVAAVYVAYLALLILRFVAGVTRSGSCRGSTAARWRSTVCTPARARPPSGSAPAM
jgi:outer membrane lipase/esterase